MDDEQRLRQQIVGRRIAARRELADLSQRALAEIMGVSQAAISSWERGERVPRWEQLRELAAAIDAPGEWLVRPLVEDFGSLDETVE